MLSSSSLKARFFSPSAKVAAAAAARASPERVREHLLQLGWLSPRELGDSLHAGRCAAVVRHSFAPRLLPSAVEAIGATPCVDLSRLGQGCSEHISDKKGTQGSSHEYSEVGQGLASIARSKAVDSAIDSHALGGLKTRMVFANSTGRQTEV